MHLADALIKGDLHFIIHLFVFLSNPWDVTHNLGIASVVL